MVDSKKSDISFKVGSVPNARDAVRLWIMTRIPGDEGHYYTSGYDFTVTLEELRVLFKALNEDWGLNICGPNRNNTCLESAIYNAISAISLVKAEYDNQAE